MSFVCVWGEVAPGVDPLTRPAPEDWVRLDVSAAEVPVFEGGDLIVDDDDIVVEEITGLSKVTGVRDLTTSRGAEMRTGSVEAGRASAQVDNRFGQLDGLKVRRRVRFMAEPPGEVARPVWTGYIERLPRRWTVADGWRDLQCVGMLGIIAEASLPASVVEAEMLAAGPVAYWPLTETSGRVADDMAGTFDGSYRRPVSGTSRLMPFDQRENAVMNPPSAEDLGGQAVTVRNLPGAPAMTVSFWVSAGEEFTERSVWVHGAGDPGPLSGSQARFWVGVGPARQVLLVEDASANRAVIFVPHGGLMDRQAHHIVVQVDAANQGLDLWIDGRPVALPEGTDYSHVDLVEMASALRVAGIGFGLTVPTSEAGAYQSGVVGHVGFWDRLLTEQEIGTIHQAGTRAWAGDLTGQRLERILDLIGVDPADRSLDPGTQTCGPTLLGGNVRAYLERIAQTEQGMIFETADGQIAFRERTPNQPPVAASYTGDPKIDPGTPYKDIVPDDGIDRLVNIARVTRENGITLTVTDPASEQTYGPVSVELETLHQTASGARSTGARLVIRHNEPRLVVTGLTILGHDTGNVPASDWLDVEIGDVVEVLCQPTGSLPFSQLSVVERVDVAARRGGERVMVLGLVEHQVLPCFALDDPSAGLDQSVMCEGAP